MKRKIVHIMTPGFLIILYLFLSNIFIVGAQSVLLHRIFILHSYEAGNVCGQPQHDGVIAALKKAGLTEKENMELQVYFMDTKQKNNTPELIDEQARLALDEISTFDPHVLVTLDDNAFRTVALNLLDSPIAIVFSGMNGQPEEYNKTKPFMVSRSQPGHNITGVYEKLHIADAVRVHSRLFPDLKKLMIFLDQSPTGLAISRQINLEMEGESIPCAWEIKVVKSWEEYQREIFLANMASDVSAIYPVAVLLKDREGKTRTAPDIFNWTVQNSTKPEIAVNYGFTKLGLFGGAAVDFHAMGCQAGRMVVRILQGEYPGNIPIEDTQRYALVFNLKRAGQLGIEIPFDILMAADEVILE